MTRRTLPVPPIALFTGPLPRRVGMVVGIAIGPRWRGEGRRMASTVQADAIHDTPSSRPLRTARRLLYNACPITWRGGSPPFCHRLPPLPDVYRDDPPQWSGATRTTAHRPKRPHRGRLLVRPWYPLNVPQRPIYSLLLPLCLCRLPKKHQWSSSSRPHKGDCSAGWRLPVFRHYESRRRRLIG